VFVLTKRSPFVNAGRSKEERRARYCFLIHCGFGRSGARGIVGRSDSKIDESYRNLDRSFC
jgi:hypothetical protein